MEEKLLIENTFKFVASILDNDYSGHDMGHITRVYNLACEIAEKITCDKLVVKLAAILHDIDDPKITKLNTGDCTKARVYLNTLQYDKEFIDKVCDIINNMSFSKNKEKKQVLTIEGMIVQDADRIDAIGAVGIARTFQFGGQHNRGMNSSIDHFDDKLLKLYDLLNTDEAKSVAKPRHDFLVDFYNQFKEETK